MPPRVALKKARLDAPGSLTRADVAQKLGVTEQAVEGWEGGKFGIDRKHFPEYAKLLGLTLNQFKQLLGMPAMVVLAGGPASQHWVIHSVGLRADPYDPVPALSAAHPLTPYLSV
jgi:transcriptional regulator with XRE-family HTH domain